MSLIVLEAGKSKIKTLAGSVSEEDSLSDIEKAIFLLCPQMEEKE
jgi:hypothetical protein